MPSWTVAEAPRRSRSLDGIRGIAIVLVVLSHSWTLLPFDNLRSAAPLDGLFHAGNLAVSVFFVIGAYFVSGSLLAQIQADGGVNPFRYFITRVIRIGSRLYPCLLAVLVVSYFDNSDPYPGFVTIRSVATSATFTWNWYLQNNPLGARSDLGHLWYLSVQEQFYLAFAIVLALWSRHRQRLQIGLIVAIIAVSLWRVHSLDTDGDWVVSLRTTTRVDALMWGSLAALSADQLAGYLSRRAFSIRNGSLAAMVILCLSAGYFHDSAYYKLQGILINVAAVGFVLSIRDIGEVHDRTSRVLTNRALVRLGQLSLEIYVWHYPIFWFVARHTRNWGWFPRTVCGLTLLTVIVVLADRFVGAPTTAWMRSHGAAVRASRKRRATSAHGVGAAIQDA